MTQIPFAFDYITPRGVHPNGVDIRFCVEPEKYGRWVEGQYQPAFMPTSFPDSMNGVHVSTYRVFQNKAARFIYMLTTLGGPDSWLAGSAAPPNHISLLCSVSGEALQAQREGRCLFVLNQLWEGFCPAHFNIFSRIQAEVEKFGLLGKNFLYLTSNLLIDEQRQAWLAANTVSQNVFEVRGYEYFGDLAQRQVRNRPSLITPYEESTFKKDYVCLNRRPHSHRLMLIAELFNRDLVKNGYVSCPPAYIANRSPNADFLGFPNSEIKWEAVKSQLPFIVDKMDFVENHAPDMTNWMYRESWFSVITETLYSSKYKTVFLSEKIYKPILFFHPFIVVSQPRFLQKLRDLGYQTFSPIINEQYDTIENDNDRLWAIVEEIKRLCSLPPEEKKKLSADMKSIVEHNHNLLLNRRPVLKDLEQTFINFIGAGG